MDVRPLHATVIGKLTDMRHRIERFYSRDVGLDCGTYLCHEALQELSYFLVRTVCHEIGKVFNPVFIDVEEHSLEKSW